MKLSYELVMNLKIYVNTNQNYERYWSNWKYSTNQWQVMIC